MSAPASTLEKTDQNGNVIYIENASDCTVRINGRNNRVRIENTNPKANFTVDIQGNDNSVNIGRCILKNFRLTIGSHQPVRGVQLTIGKNFSIEPNGAFEIFTNFARINIGEQCMFSRNITLHYGDNPHLIFDQETGTYIDGAGEVSIGRKVWVGEGVYLSKRATIAEESIVAARSVVTRAFDTPNCVIGGNPARIVKQGVQWFRNRSSLPKESPYAAAMTAYDASVEGNDMASTTNPDVPKATWQDHWPKDTTLLVGVGAMKAGTSWLYDYLAGHPQVHFSPLKETHYFDVISSPGDRHHLKTKIKSLQAAVANLQDHPVDTLTGRIERVERALAAVQIYKQGETAHEHYRKYLTEGHKNQRVIGDITPSYCTLSSERLAEIHALAPSTKFIFVMRDPIDRLWSAIRMRVKQLDKDDFDGSCRALGQEVLRNPKHPMLTRSGYEQTLKNLYAAAPAEDIQVLFYESMFAQTTRDMICDFLGIDRRPGSDSKKVNAGQPAEIPADLLPQFRKLLAPEYEAVRALFPDRVPAEWKGGGSAS